jgi:hypothetical protein
MTTAEQPPLLADRESSQHGLEHLRIVNSIWLSPPVVNAFARVWRTEKARNP